MSNDLKFLLLMGVCTVSLMVIGICWDTDRTTAKKTNGGIYYKYKYFPEISIIIAELIILICTFIAFNIGYSEGLEDGAEGYYIEEIIEKKSPRGKVISKDTTLLPWKIENKIKYEN